jgi:hypothetical protein
MRSQKKLQTITNKGHILDFCQSPPPLFMFYWNTNDMCVDMFILITKRAGVSERKLNLLLSIGIIARGLISQYSHYL